MPLQDESAISGNFNARTAVPPVGARPDVALIIDVQGGNGHTDGYLAHLAKSIESLRHQKIPVVWVSMSPQNDFRLFRPAGDSAQRRSGEELEAMGYNPQSTDAGNVSYRAFIREHGPRRNEAVYAKFFESALIAPEDYAADPALKDFLIGQFPESVRDSIRESLESPRSEDSLARYLQEQGYSRPLIMGTMSTHCPTQTALWAVKKGMNPVLATDGVLSWDTNDENNVKPGVTAMVWRKDGEGTADGWNAYHEAKMKSRLHEIVSNEADVRSLGLTDDDIAALQAMEFVTVEEAVQTPAAAASLQNRKSASSAPIRQI